MNRRRALAALVSPLACPLLAGAGAGGGSKKKGWAGGDARLHELFGTNWYYTWSPKTRPSRETEFVPMIKGEWGLRQAPAIEEMGGISHLLGFNEPEREKQGNVSVARALELWPQLVALAEKKGLRLGSPAPSSNRAGLAWLARFMEGAKRLELKIDFVAVHWYRSRNAREFEAFVDQLARDYRLPIWVTEFNGWEGTEREHFSFLRDALRFLERNDNIERYAYFNPAKGRPASLLKADGSISRMGELYRDV